MLFRLWAAGMNHFMEIAKMRAARLLWARIVKQFNPQNPKSMALRTHTQTSGWGLTEQDPFNNVALTCVEALAAALGHTQSLHTNGFDEALALPTEDAARIALRTQQIIAAESGAVETIDPFAGSYYIESLTDDIESRASELIEKVDELGGSVNAITFITNEIEESAWGYQERYRVKQDIVVGVNEYVTDELEVPDTLRVDQKSEDEQLARLAAFKENRDQERVAARLEEIREAARGTANLLPVLREALRDHCTVGEVCGAMRDVFGSYTPEF